MRNETAMNSLREKYDANISLLQQTEEGLGQAKKDLENMKEHFRQKEVDSSRQMEENERVKANLETRLQQKEDQSAKDAEIITKKLNDAEEKHKDLLEQLSQQLKDVSSAKDELEAALDASKEQMAKMGSSYTEEINSIKKEMDDTITQLKGDLTAKSTQIEEL
eukprot:538412-Ditylum_brightwellii.AAC.1